MKLIAALSASAVFMAISAPAFAGSVGTSATNSSYRETVRGERTMTGYSQSQENIGGTIRSQAIKVEFGGEPGFRGAANLGINNNGSSANCSVAANVDPFCKASLTDEYVHFNKQTNSASHYSEKATFVGEEYSHTLSTGASF